MTNFWDSNVWGFFNLCALLLASLLTAIQTHLDRRAAGRMKVGAAIFSNEYGSLGETAEAGRMRKEWA